MTLLPVLEIVRKATITISRMKLLVAGLALPHEAQRVGWNY
jgi:hypothetical protein